MHSCRAVQTMGQPTGAREPVGPFAARYWGQARCAALPPQTGLVAVLAWPGSTARGSTDEQRILRHARHACSLPLGPAGGPCCHTLCCQAERSRQPQHWRCSGATGQHSAQCGRLAAWNLTCLWVLRRPRQVATQKADFHPPKPWASVLALGAAMPRLLGLKDGAWKMSHHSMEASSPSTVWSARVGERCSVPG